VRLSATASTPPHVLTLCFTSAYQRQVRRCIAYVAVDRSQFHAAARSQQHVRFEDVFAENCCWSFRYAAAVQMQHMLAVQVTGVPGTSSSKVSWHKRLPYYVSDCICITALVVCPAWTWHTVGGNVHGSAATAAAVVWHETAITYYHWQPGTKTYQQPGQQWLRWSAALTL